MNVIDKALRKLGLSTDMDDSKIAHIRKPTATGAVRFTFAMAAIYKNEAAYIEEWLDYHLMIGVEKFFLYDNGCTDHTNDLLQKYVASGSVKVIPWPHFLEHTSTQAAAYAHAIALTAGNYRWLAALDIDEFLVPVDKKNLRETLSGLEGCPSLLIYWFMFGPNGHEKKPTEGVLESYTKRQKMPYEQGSSANIKVAKRRFKTKFIVQPLLARKFVATHFVGTTSLPVLGHDEDGYPIHKLGQGPFKGSRLRINHYFTKSVEELKVKMNNDRVARPGSKRSPARMNAILSGFADDNCIDDRTILDVIAKYKKD